jgi:DNA-binding NarL/FixJ family response regulator
MSKITMAKARTILVVDDHILFREGLVSLLHSTPDFEVVGGAGSVHEGITMAVDLDPNIILMDFSMPDGTGLDATRAILRELPKCKIVFLTVNERDDALFAAIRAGAKGYLLKNTPSMDLIAGLRAMDRDEMAMTRHTMSKVLNEFSQAPPLGQTLTLVSKLSPRELDVLRELGTGATNQEIAGRLYLSENTVKHHIRSVLEKLGVENRRQAGEVARLSHL